MTDAHHHHQHAHAPAHAGVDRRWRRIDLGFTAGAGLRLAAAALFAIAAVGAAMVVADGGAHLTSTVVPAITPSATTAICTIEIESTYPVRRWTLLSDGKPLTASMDAARLWRGEVAVGATIMVEAEAADPLDNSLTALRVGFRGAGWSHHIETWGHGSISTTIICPGPSTVKP